jgi:hypothetical protein
MTINNHEYKYNLLSLSSHLILKLIPWGGGGTSDVKRIVRNTSLCN